MRWVWSSVDTQFAKMLGLGTLVPTRCTDDQTLIDLGIMVDYYTLIDSMGFGNLTRMMPHLSTKLVNEFLSTTTLHFEDPLRPRADVGSINFFIHRNLHRISFSELCNVFGSSIIRAHICLGTGMLLSSGTSLDLEVTFFPF